MFVYSDKNEQREVLMNLTSVGKNYNIGFKSMLDLMNKCDEVEPLIPPGQSTALSMHPIAEVTGVAFSGVLPGEHESVTPNFKSSIQSPATNTKILAHT